jgi:hypothetical protein
MGIWKLKESSQVILLTGLLALSIIGLSQLQQVNADKAADHSLQKILSNMTLNQDIQLARIGRCDAALGTHILEQHDALLALLKVADIPGKLVPNC